MLIGIIKLNGQRILGAQQPLQWSLTAFKQMVEQRLNGAALSDVQLHIIKCSTLVINELLLYVSEAIENAESLLNFEIMRLPSGIALDQTVLS